MATCSWGRAFKNLQALKAHKKACAAVSAGQRAELSAER